MLVTRVVMEMVDVWQWQLRRRETKERRKSISKYRTLRPSRNFSHAAPVQRIVNNVITRLVECTFFCCQCCGFWKRIWRFDDNKDFIYLGTIKQNVEENLYLERIERTEMNSFLLIKACVTLSFRIVAHFELNGIQEIFAQFLFFFWELYVSRNLSIDKIGGRQCIQSYRMLFECNCSIRF